MHTRASSLYSERFTNVVGLCANGIWISIRVRWQPQQLLASRFILPRVALHYNRPSPVVVVISFAISFFSLRFWVFFSSAVLVFTVACAKRDRLIVIRLMIHTRSSVPRFEIWISNFPRNTHRSQRTLEYRTRGERSTIALICARYSDRGRTTYT